MNLEVASTKALDALIERVKTASTNQMTLCLSDYQLQMLCDLCGGEYSVDHLSPMGVPEFTYRNAYGLLFKGNLIPPSFAQISFQLEKQEIDESDQFRNLEDVI